MVNEVIVVGKLAKEPVLNQTNTGQKVSNIVLETIRHYKNSCMYIHNYCRNYLLL